MMPVGVFMRSSATGIGSVIVLASMLAFGGCGPQPVPQPPPPPKPVGLWTGADSQAVAKDLSESALHQQWLIAFHTHANRQPKVCIKPFVATAIPGGDSATAAAALPAVVNDDLEADCSSLVEQFSAALAASQQLEVVGDPAAADYVFTGRLSRELISEGARYPVDLRLLNPAGDTIWTGGLEHTISAPPAPPAAAPAESPAPK